MAENKNRYGKMWECPDFFELDGKYVLLTSPQDMLPEGLEFHNGNGTLCIIGELDPAPPPLPEQFCLGADFGIDFFADTACTGWTKNYDRLDAELGYACISMQ